MKNNYLILALVLGAFMFQSCDNDDDKHPANQQIERAFWDKYPDAKRTEWEIKGNYSVVDFYSGNKESEAWFDQSGIWYMTEIDLYYDDLPQAVKNSFSASDYGAWWIDDIDMIERRDMETIYILEIEQNKQEYDLYYSPEGILIKTIIDPDNSDDHTGYLPTGLPETIKTYLNTHHPQARILETENERGMIEVDIVDGNTYWEIMFKADGEWVYSKTEVLRKNVPQTVINAFTASQYSSYTIDDIHFIKTPLRDYYYFDVESHSQEVDLIITIEGNIEVVKISND